MKKWVIHHRKLVTVIIALLFIILLLLRSFVFHETNPSGQPDNTALVRSLFDNLMATILVTCSVTISLNWLKSPIEENISETYIQPFNIDDCLRTGAVNTREWNYLGHTARYIRSQILPFINIESRARNQNKKIKIIILDPVNNDLCKFYAMYRNDSRSSLKSRDQWNAEGVKSDLLASVLCMIELHQANSMLEIDVGFLSKVSLFRADISSSMVLITQEDSQEPGIRYSSESQFYRYYLRELDLAWQQSQKLKISSVVTMLSLDNISSIRKCLEEVKVITSGISDKTLKDAGILAKIKESPYVSR